MLVTMKTTKGALGAFVCILVCSFAFGMDDKLPARLDGVSIDEKLGEDVPLDVQFMDDEGGVTSLGELLKDGNPIILTLNYSDCPGLCVAQLNGLSRGINEVSSLGVGKDFKMVSISINPRESRERASSTKAKYCESLADNHSSKGWSFLIGSEVNIQKITKAVGFNYTFDAKHDRYNHAAAAIFISPKGRITRYLYEIGFTPETLKMALVEAGEGKIGSFMDAFVLKCFHYDAMENRYTASGRTLLSVAAGLFVTFGLIASLPFWISSRRFRNRARSNPQVQIATLIIDSTSPSH